MNKKILMILMLFSVSQVAWSQGYAMLIKTRDGNRTSNVQAYIQCGTKKTGRAAFEIFKEGGVLAIPGKTRGGCSCCLVSEEKSPNYGNTYHFS